MHPRLRAAAAWQLGALLQASGDIERACPWFESCKHLDPFVAQHLQTLVSIAASCRIRLDPLVESLEKWRRLSREADYPATLDVLVPSMLGHLPTCTAGTFYRVNRHRNRYLVGCRLHRRLFDSTLGTVARGASFPPPIGSGM